MWKKTGCVFCLFLVVLCSLDGDGDVVVEKEEK